MATSTRAFTIFVDGGESALVDSKQSHETTTVTVPFSGPPIVFVPNKENIDPLTGTRALSEQSLGKRRKTTVALKAQPPSPSKKPRPLAEKGPKKPSTSKTRSSDKKAKRSTAKRAGPSRTLREPSLPRLVEEREEHEALTQETIDAKCKELTVLPLADISEAYEQAVPKEALPEVASKTLEQKVAVAAVSDDKVERPATPPPTEKEDAAPSPAPVAASGSVFATPERKRIYSAFTFESPSPASTRYASARGSSVERFSDVVF